MREAGIAVVFIFGLVMTFAVFVGYALARSLAWDVRRRSFWADFYGDNFCAVFADRS